MPYASSTDTVFSGVSDTMRFPANKWSTLAEIASSDSPKENPRLPGLVSGASAKPLIAYLFGSCDKCAYVPWSTAEIAGLKALIPAEDEEAGSGAGGGAVAVSAVLEASA